MNVEMKFQQRILGAESFQQPRWKKYTLSDSAPEQVGMADGKYQIVPITPKDAAAAIDFLRRFFFKDEPLNVDISLLGENGDDTCIELEEYSTQCIPEGLSLMAVSTSGKVIGVILNGSHEPGHEHEMEADVENCPNPKFQKVLRLLTKVEIEAGIFQKFPEIKKLLEVRILSVDDSWRGKGIATALLEKTRELGIQQGFPLIRVDCTSHFSAKAVARLGMECIYTLKYDQYKHNDQIVFQPTLPHTEVKTYIQRIVQ